MRFKSKEEELLRGLVITAWIGFSVLFIQGIFFISIMRGMYDSYQHTERHSQEILDKIKVQNEVIANKITDYTAAILELHHHDYHENVGQKK